MTVQLGDWCRMKLRREVDLPAFAFRWIVVLGALMALFGLAGPPW